MSVSTVKPQLRQMHDNFVAQAEQIVVSTDAYRIYEIAKKLLLEADFGLELWLEQALKREDDLSSKLATTQAQLASVERTMAAFLKNPTVRESVYKTIPVVNSGGYMSTQNITEQYTKEIE